MMEKSGRVGDYTGGRASGTDDASVDSTILYEKYKSVPGRAAGFSNEAYAGEAA